MPILPSQLETFLTGMIPQTSWQYSRSERSEAKAWQLVAQCSVVMWASMLPGPGFLSFMLIGAEEELSGLLGPFVLLGGAAFGFSTGSELVEMFGAAAGALEDLFCCEVWLEDGLVKYCRSRIL